MTALFSCFSIAAIAQTPVTLAEKKSDTPKTKDGDSAKSKGKDSPKTKPIEMHADTSKEIAKPKIPLDKLKTPNGAIVVLVDEIREALGLFPKMVLLTPEQYQDLQERIKALERQLKVEKQLPHSCKLHGKLEGDYLAIRADFAFSTYQPRTSIFLGMLGAHLMDEGDLDRQIPILDSTEDGFVARVEKEGNHQLTLNLRVRVDVKKAAAGGTERGVELGLPGTAVTTFHLELPANVKELRWNDNLEKTKIPGRWHLGLEKSKTLSLFWKEPAAMTGNTPLSKVEGLTNVRIDETHVNITTDLFLEDLRFQTKEWRLLLPAQAKVDVKPPGGLSYQWIEPEGATPYHTLRLQDATAERWQVSVFQRVPRPNPGVRLPIGPFVVLGAFQQQGAINIRMATEASLGQRLVYHRQGDIYQVQNSETESTFQYLAPSAPEKIQKSKITYKAPLELEWRYEKNQLETRVEHAVKVKTVKQGWEIEATTVIHVKAIFSGINALDLKLPLPRSRGMSLLGTALPFAGYPAMLPWGGVGNPFGMPWMDGTLDDSAVLDELGNVLKLVAQDSFGKTRVIWERSPTKQVLKLKSLIRVSAQNQRLRLQLPRPLNTLDRGAKMTIQTDDRIELLHGILDKEEPVPDKQHFEWSWDQSPSGVDLAWRPFHREVTAHAIIDVILHENTAQVRQAIHFPWDQSSVSDAEAKQHLIRLNVPRPIDKIAAPSGGIITSEDFARQTVWLRPTGESRDDIDLVLQYDLALTKKTSSADAVSIRSLSVPIVWPAIASRKDVKVRIWSHAGGVKVRLPEDLLNRGLWKERSTEIVPGKDRLPVMVLEGTGTQLPLALKIEASAASTLAPFLADRGLIQVTMNDDDSEQCRARFFIYKINAQYLDVELPLPVSRLRERPTFLLGSYALTDWQSLDGTGKTIRLQLNPDLHTLPAILEISYTLPPDALERATWRTTLYPPVFPAPVVIKHLRWQLTLPVVMLATSFEKQVRGDSKWSLQGGLLTPEPSVTGGSLEMWLTGKESAQPAAPIAFAFDHAELQPHVIYHAAKKWWLLAWSGLFLILTLAVYLSPVTRLVFGLFLLGLAIVALLVGIIWPASLPLILFGCQPGVALFVLFVGAHWCWQERSRRQVVFLPAFSRTKPSSTLSRGSSAKRPRDVSTVDSPAALEGGPGPTSSGLPAGS